MLDKEVRERFKEFQKRTRKHEDLYIDDVRFEEKALRELHIREKVKTRNTTTANKFIEIGDIDRVTKKYDITNKTKDKLPAKGKYAPKGSILVSRVRPLLGGYTIIDGDDYTFTSGDLNPIVLPDEIFVNYVFHIICSPKFEAFLKRNQNTAGQKPTITDKLYDFNIPIPNDLNKFYPSYKIQEAIVEFLEFWRDYTNAIRERVLKKKPIYEAIKNLVVRNTFKYDKFLVKKFDKFAQDRGFDFKLSDIEFEEKPLKKLVAIPIKGGGTPDTQIKEYWHNDFSLIDNVNYFGWRNIEKDLFNEKIISKYSKVISKKGLESSSSWLVPAKSILIAIASASKGLIIINDKSMCTNQNILGVVINEKNNNTEYIYYMLKNIYRNLDGKKEFGNLTKGSEENRNILIPKELSKIYTSQELQKILVEFWEMVIGQIDTKLAQYDRMLELCDIVDRAFLYRTFTKIDWSQR